MTDFKHISPDNKERLVELINKTASLVNEGSTPTDALVKAASLSEYPPEYVLRAAEAYNGAAHLSYFKSAELEKRGDSFLLADGAAALERVLNSGVSPNKKSADTSLAFLAEPTNYFDEPLADDGFAFQEKQAAAPEFNQMLKSSSVLGKQERLTVELYKNSYNQACVSLASSIGDFKTKTAGNTPYRRAHWAREMLERHGKLAEAIVSVATGISLEECTKLANDRVGFFSLGTKELDSLDSIIRGFNQTANLHDKLAQAEHDAYVNNLERGALLDLAAGVKRSGLADILDLSRAGIESATPGTDSSSDSIQRGALDSLVDPDFVSANSKIDKSLLLHKLMKNDPIIGSRTPKELEQALSEVSSIAPTAAKKEPLLRSMLRRRLEAGDQIDDFSLNQMLSMEDSVRSQGQNWAVAPKLTGGWDERPVPRT